MLNTLRQQLDNKFIQAMLVLLVLSFALWGVGDMLRTKKNNAVIKVGKIEYTAAEWHNALENQLRALQEQLGQQVAANMKNSPQFRSHVLQQLINRALLMQEAEKLKIITSDEMAKIEIAHMPAFFDKDGKFNADNFTQVLRNNNLNENKFIEMLREDISINNLFTSFASNKKSLPQLSSLVWKFLQADRIMTLYKIPTTAFKVDAPAQDEELVETLKNNIAQFTLPEKRKGRYIIFDKANVSIDEKVDEKQLLDLYNNRHFLFTEPTKHNVWQVILESKEKAEQLTKELEAGESFPDLAKKYSKPEYKADLGLINSQELPEEIGRVIGAMQAGQHSAPVQSPFGWHVFWIKEIKQAHLSPFTEVREKVLRIYLNEAISLKIANLTQEIEQALAAGKAFAEVAAQHKLTVHEATLSSNSQQDESLAKNGIKDFAEFKNQLFNTDTGKVSAAMPTGDEQKGGESYFILHTDELTPAVEQELAQVRPQVLAIWRQQEQQKQLSEFTNEFSAALANGDAEVLGKFKEENKTKFSIVENVSLRKEFKADEYSQETIKEIMELPEGAISLPITNKNGDYVVIQIRSIADPKEKMNAEEEMRLNNALAQMEEQIMMAQYLKALQKHYSVEINHEALQN